MKNKILYLVPGFLISCGSLNLPWVQNQTSIESQNIYNSNKQESEIDNGRKIASSFLKAYENKYHTFGFAVSLYQIKIESSSAINWGAVFPELESNSKLISKDSFISNLNFETMNTKIVKYYRTPPIFQSYGSCDFSSSCVYQSFNDITYVENVKESNGLTNIIPGVIKTGYSITIKPSHFESGTINFDLLADFSRLSSTNNQVNTLTKKPKVVTLKFKLQDKAESGSTILHSYIDKSDNDVENRKVMYIILINFQG